MDYEQEEKGLFTFYRQQAEQQEEVKRQKKNKKKKLVKGQSGKQRSLIDYQSLLNRDKPKDKNFNINIEQKTAPLKVYQFSQPTQIKNMKGSKTSKVNKLIQKIPLSPNFMLLKQRSIELRNKSNFQFKQNGSYLKNKKFPCFESQICYEFVNGQIQKLPRDLSQKAIEDNILKKQRKCSELSQLSKLLKLQISRSVSQRYDYETNSLPMIDNLKRRQYIIPKRYKSKKIEQALKSGDGQKIKRIRESLKQGNSDISYINLSQQSILKEQKKDQLAEVKERNLDQILKKFKNNISNY